MATATVTEKNSKTRRSVRSGRPPKEFAGEVDERILEAARKVFLERGFEGASVDEIAETARAGKPTIYARFSNKQALFKATLMRHVADKHTRVASYSPSGSTVEERLASIGAAVLRETLTSEGIGLVRLGIAEARNFPDLGNSVCRIAREQGAETVARLLGEVAECSTSGASPAFSQDSTMAARYFLDLIVLPLFMRALAGESLETLHAEIGRHVAERVAFFLAACRHGGIR
ncbi:MAG: TetR/AcrR family transcriptional regulator [Rhodomicrobium sp.]